MTTDRPSRSAEEPRAAGQASPLVERISLGAGERRGPETSTLGTVLVVLEGAGELRAGGRTSITEGDTVWVGAGRPYELVALGDGLRILRVPEWTAGESRAVTSLDALVARSAARAEGWRRGPMFAALDRGALDDPSRRSRIVAGARAFLEAYEAVLLLRQATCRDDDYAPSFRDRLRDALDRHAVWRAQYASTPITEDPFVLATTTWFARQALVADNAEKAVLVELVLEGAATHLAAKLFGVAPPGAGPAPELSHLPLLRDGTTAARLERVVEDGWDMLVAMSDRVARSVDGGARTGELER